MDNNITLLVIFFILGIYLLPFWIAKGRKHNNANAIGILNVFLGWTFFGWVIALTWASTNNVNKVKTEAVKEYCDCKPVTFSNVFKPIKEEGLKK